MLALLYELDNCSNINMVYKNMLEMINIVAAIVFVKFDGFEQVQISGIFDLIKKKLRWM